MQLRGMKVAVTVDDVPAHGDLLPGTTRLQTNKSILNTLKANGLTKVYGFANGKDAVVSADAMQSLNAWLLAKYPLGNHTFSHSDLDQTGTIKYLSDIQRMQHLLSELAPEPPNRSDFTFFRYPYLHEGATLEQRHTVRKFLFDNRYRIAEVTVDWDDWAWNDAYTRCARRHDDKSITWLKREVIITAENQLRNSKRAARQLFNRDIAQILLLHDSMFTAAILDSLLRDLRHKGVAFISLDYASKDPVYDIDPGVTPSDGGTFLSRIALARHVDIGYVVDTSHMPSSLNAVCK